MAKILISQRNACNDREYLNSISYKILKRKTRGKFEIIGDILRFLERNDGASKYKIMRGCNL